MKNLILTLGIMSTIISQSVAAEKSKYKEDIITLESDFVNVSANELWQIIGPGFEKAGHWSTAVDHAVGKGEAKFKGATCDERFCELNAKGFSSIKEVITLYNEKNQEFAFDVTEGNPGFVKKVNSHWEVVKVSDTQSKLRITITMHTAKFMGFLMGGMMRANINKVIPTIFRDLKVFAETGDISEQKKERMAILAKKYKSFEKS